MLIKIILLFTLGCFTLAVSAQTLVHGAVYDADTQQPLEGVTIHVAHTGIFTFTKKDGSFTLPALPVKDSVYATYTGYKPYTFIIAAAATTVTVYLQNQAAQIESVTVNTGYQRMPKERSTGSFSVINNRLINRSVGTNIFSRIENLAPGILINHGDAAKHETISIRGRSTIYANASPLIVIDNFPYDGDINNINPNDVESITILKDAAAASVWGARAGNGVIVITTKKGSALKPQVEVNINTSVQGKPDLFNISQISGSDYAYLESYLFKKGFYKSLFHDPYHTPLPPVATLLHEVHTGAVTQQDADRQIKDLENHDVRSDLEQYFYQPQVQQQYAFNVSGKTDKINYYLSAGYDNNKSSLVGGRFDRISMRNISSYQPFEWLQLNTGINYTQTTNRTGNNPGYDYYSLLQSKQYLPYTKLIDANGQPLPVYEDYNKDFIDAADNNGDLLDWTYRPLADINQQVTTLKNIDYVMYAGWNMAITKALHIEGRYQYENESINNVTLYGAGSYFTRNLVNNFSEPQSGNTKYIIPRGGIRDASSGTLTSHQGRLQAGFNKDWNNKHQFTAIAGFEIRSTVNFADNSRAYGYDAAHNTVYDHIDFSNYYPQYSSPDYYKVPNNQFLTGNTDHFISYYTNAGYTYNRCYTFTASARIDEANLFGVKTNQKGTPLWSAGAAWQLSKESFYRISWLPVLKLRATYGYNGNISRQATAYSTISYNTGVLTPLPIAFVINPANPNLKWEKTAIANIGIDFSTAKNVLSGSIELYTKHAVDLIGTAPVDPTLGISAINNPSYYGNVAAMHGRGIDAQITSLNISQKLQWSTTLNLSYAKTKVTAYYLPAVTNGGAYVPDNAINPVPGNPLFSVYSYKWFGLDTQNGNPIGMVNGKETEDYFNIYNTPVDSLQYNGSAEPTVYGAVRNDFTFKNFSLSFSISYKFGYYFRTKSVDYSTLFYSWNGNGDFAHRWQKPGDEKSTHVPSLVYPDSYYRDNFYAYADVLVANAGNIRLEDINLSYNLSRQQFKPLPAQSIKLFIYADNLGVLWLKNSYKIDPYYNNIARDAKAIAVGINIIF